MQRCSSHISGKEKTKLVLRRILAALLFYTGLTGLCRLLAGRNQAVVVMYHRVIDSAELNQSFLQPGMHVTKEAFEMQMKYLSSKYQVVSLGWLIETIKRGIPIRSNTCVITFDDGWKDTYTNAFPVLKRYNLPATVFLISSYVGTHQWLRSETCSYLLTKYFESPHAVEPDLRMYPTLQGTRFFQLASCVGLTAGQKLDNIIDSFKKVDEEVRERAIHELEDLVAVRMAQEYRKPLMLDWDEVREMSRFQITFGSHTKSHAILTNIPREKAQEEVEESKRDIQMYLSKSCWAFAYPNGAYDDQVARMVGEDYSCAFATERGFVSPGDDLFRLRRIGIHNDITFTKSLFACRLSSLWASTLR